ncbi:thioredoxin family protein [uncultured Dokdonia sp.]|uniref:thioredoxin family protein n=1 Tax=uncultured Dokdonia sp. TaxID=575653 RepID=UPI00261E49F9|nr:thioredoxin family protein [uncultured Dokdonia sp.]
MKRLFFILFITIAAVSNAQEATWLTDFDKAKRVAKKEKKPILMYFTGSDWCGPCKMLKKDFWQHSEFLKQANDFVLLEVDVPFREDIITPEQFKKNKELQKKYNKDGAFPTLLALDANGKIKERISAYSMLRDTSGYFAFLDKARAIR